MLPYDAKSFIVLMGTSGNISHNDVWTFDTSTSNGGAWQRVIVSPQTQVPFMHSAACGIKYTASQSQSQSQSQSPSDESFVQSKPVIYTFGGVVSSNSNGEQGGKGDLTNAIWALDTGVKPWQWRVVSPNRDA
ncbi:hypothetical protein HK102_009325, partial [Quaeritorhiza haematococci]